MLLLLYIAVDYFLVPETISPSVLTILSNQPIFHELCPVYTKFTFGNYCSRDVYTKWLYFFYLLLSILI